LVPLTGAALPCTVHPDDCGGSGFSLGGKSGTITTSVMSDFFFDGGGAKPICLGSALAADDVAADAADASDFDVEAWTSACVGTNAIESKRGGDTGPRSTTVSSTAALAAIAAPASNAARISGRSLKPAIAAIPSRAIPQTE
jgi:hypothetical protein